jgi:hypothetical protein
MQNKFILPSESQKIIQRPAAMVAHHACAGNARTCGARPGKSGRCWIPF